MRMVRVLAAAFAASTIAGGAFAADLPSRTRAPQPAYVAPAPLFTWSGLYVGLNAGGWVDATKMAAIGPFAGSGKLGGGGFIGGGQIGYNWQTASRVVIGVETDIDYRSKANVTPPYSTSVNSSDGYLGTARVRVGYGMDRALLYVTGGLAYGNAVAPNAVYSPFFAGGRSVNNPTFNIGWTAGAGAEFALTNNWSVKGEYLYANLGSKSLAYNTNAFLPTTVSATSAAHTGRVGVNYRFGFGGAPVYAKY